jgi:hypothetical protein
MSIGKREREKQDSIWIEAASLATPGGHLFYEKLKVFWTSGTLTSSRKKRAGGSIRKQDVPD